jgi:hypothetical protein
MQQAPPWKIAIPFVLFCSTVMTTWYFSREPTALLAAGLGCVMGIIWTYGAWNVRREEKQLAASGKPRRPTKNNGTVLCRARLGRFKSAGYLVGAMHGLFWAPIQDVLRPGEHIPLKNMTSMVFITPYDGIRFESRSRMFGGERLTLYRDNQRPRRIWLLDPEGLPNLLSMLSDDNEA